MLQEKLLDLIDELAENNREQTKVLQELSNPNGSTISVVSRFAELAGQNALLIVNAKTIADEIREDTKIPTGWLINEEYSRG